MESSIFRQGLSQNQAGPNIIRHDRGALQVCYKLRPTYLGKRIKAYHKSKGHRMPDEQLMLQMRHQRQVLPKMQYINTYKRESTIIAEWLGQALGVWNGVNFELIFITEGMLGKKLSYIVPYKQPYKSPGPLGKSYEISPRLANPSGLEGSDEVESFVEEQEPPAAVNVD